MALVDTTWYANSVAYAAVTQFAISTAYTAGQRVRQLATPAVGSERVFIVIVAGTSAASEPSWTLTRGAKTVSNTVTFQECTGQAALNGDLTNTQTWAAVKAVAPAVLGQIIKKSTNASYQICTTAGTMGASEPAFSDTAGVTTTETAAVAVWTSLGPVGSYTGGMAPSARLTNVFTTNWFAAGGTVYVASNHAETSTAAITISPANSTAIPVGRILCHNVSGSYPPASGDLTTGATISTTGAVNITISPSGATYWYGITFKAGVGVGTSTEFVLIQPSGQAITTFDNCSFWLAGTAVGNTAYIQVMNNGSTVASTVVWNNCTVKFALATQTLASAAGVWIWQSTGPVLASGSAVPAFLLTLAAPGVGATSSIVWEALDLSQITTSLIGTVAAAGPHGISVRDCKLHASASVYGGTPFPYVTAQLARSSS